MAKIYILLVHQVYESADIRLDAIPYTNYDKAKEVFDEIVSDETKFANYRGWEFDDNNNDTNFCIFEKGRFCENNTVVQLNEAEI